MAHVNCEEYDWIDSGSDLEIPPSVVDAIDLIPSPSKGEGRIFLKSTHRPARHSKKCNSSVVRFSTLQHFREIAGSLACLEHCERNNNMVRRDPLLVDSGFSVCIIAGSR